MAKLKHSDIVVHKFGGSSLIDAKSYKTVAKRLTGKNEIIVVSATKGTTSALQACLDLAQAGKAFQPDLEQLHNKHKLIIETLLDAKKAASLLSELASDITSIHDLLHAIAIVQGYSPEQQDVVIGFGEQWSAKILSALLSQHHQTLYLNAAKVLYTHKKRGNIYVDWERSEQALAETFKQKSFDQLVITGFLACNADAKQVTLGRNCSDFSASIFAKLFNAKQLIIWKDTDGVFSADPTRVRSAFPIEHLSYESALELAYFGAAVIHPKTIAPAMEENIPIYIKNTQNPEAKGTVIAAGVPASALPVQGITSISNIALISIEGTGLIGVCGTAKRVFSALEQAEISVILISQASSEHSICFAVESKAAEQAVTVLTDAFEFEIAQHFVERITADKHCAILAVVGDNMVGSVGVAGRLASTLAKANINIKAIAQGSSERNISMVIAQDDINKALRAVHSGFYLSDKTLSIGIIGPGIVGSALINQIAAALNRLQQQHQVRLQVRGICNSKKMILSDSVLDLNHWESQLKASQLNIDLTTFVDHVIADDIPHAVIIDCSANQGIADCYIDFVKKGAHVITPNKRAGSGDYQYYQELKKTLAEKHRHYLYETTVCAGLPVMTTLHDIIQTGDEVLQIEGVVSGTISYIFNQLAKGLPFSQIIKEAKTQGYTEPDPRDDLAGTDVARKVVILARELGHAVSLEDVHIENLVPEKLRACSVEAFMSQLENYDAEIAASIQSKIKPGESAAYVGCITQEGRVDVGIKSYPKTHPFAQLKGTDNILIFKTRRYFEQPLVIQGPGAGAEVTAAGVFADLLRLESYIAD